MAVLQATIRLRYGTYAEWMNSDVILEPGEAAVAIFNFSNTLENTDHQPSLTPPAVGLKIGNGQKYFYELPWVQAVAADVYDWAKQATKPDYSASEIIGLEDFIINHGGSGGSGGGDAASSGYRIIYDSVTQKYILQYYDETQNEWINTASEINLSTIFNRIATIERWANGARTNLGNIEAPIAEYIYDEVLAYMNTIDYNDVSVEHQFVTSVVQTDGQIEVFRSALDASDITTGRLPTEHGGTGLNFVDEDEVLIGSVTGDITTKKFVTEIDNNRQAFATVGAITDYVNEKTAGITGAMHFVGESTVEITTNPQSRVNPNIIGYNFNEAQAGDVILANNAQEFVWTGGYWRLLGDEGSYAIKGSIKNADIAEDAMIAQSKIDNLSETLDTKVDKVAGKQLSTNDYTDADKEKLDTIEDEAQVNLIEHILLNDTEITPVEKVINLQIPVLTEEQLNTINTAQANLIEHIFVNGTEVSPIVINQLPKSVNINFIPYTQEEKDKLRDVETGAQVNKIETIVINGREYTASNNKQVEITIDQAALNLNVLEGARYPVGNTYADIDITNKKLELSQVAATGNIDHLVQTADTYVIFNCGSSTEVI